MSATSSIVADFALAPEGAKKIRWVAQHAPVLIGVSIDSLTAEQVEIRRGWQ